METRALRFGPDGELVWGTHHVPAPAEDEVVIEIAASGLNRADLLQRRGFYPPPPGAPDVPGLEYAGTVVARGPGATRHAIGARVMGIVAGGGLARHIVVHEGEAMPVPDHLELAHAAAIPEAFLTAHDALFSQASLQSGERVLIHAVASGVGAAAVRLAAQAGAVVIGTTRTEAKLDALRKAVGAVPFTGLVVGDAGFVSRLDAPIDVVFDLVGASYFAENLDAIATKGRWIVIGALGGTSAELPLHTLLSKRITLRGTVLRPRPRAEKIAAASAFVRDFGAALDRRELAPVVDRVLPVEQVEDAWAAMAGNETVGKVVVSW